MRLSVVFICLLFYANISAQEGFIKSYDFYEEKGFSFHHISLKEDTIISVGSFSNPDIGQWGLFFGKIDTLGNILDYRVHYLPNEQSIVFVDAASVIKTGDNGYAVIGNNFNTATLMLFKLDENGEKEFFKEYPDNEVFQVWHRDIVEFEHGYIYVGAKQQMDDGLNDAFAMRLDKEGSVVWEIDYGEYELSDNFWNVTKINNNQFRIHGASGVSTPTVNPDMNSWFSSFVLDIDSLGNITPIWQGGETSQVNGLTDAFHNILFDQAGNGISTSIYNSVDEVLGEPTLLSKPTLISWDEDYNILWHTTFKDASNTAGKNRFNALAQTPDNGWVAVGSYSNILDYETYEGYRTGLIAKINSEGDSLWCRIDTVLTPSYGAKPKLESVVVLPSGSIIAAGQVDRLYPKPAKSFGWLIKVDKYGCIEPGCNPTTNLTMTPSVINFEIFPNPTSDYLSVKGEGDFSVRIYGIGGQQFCQKNKNQDNINIDMSSLPKGFYFVQIQKGNHYLTKKIIKE